MSPITTPVPVQHIVLDEQGRPCIEGTRLKVVDLIAWGRANGWSAEELARQFPHLSVAQIHAALSYYYDHQPAIDREIDRLDREYDEHRRNAPESSLARRLREGRSAGQ
jgi:uncharacterized protein (DUF433 family)